MFLIPWGSEHAVAHVGDGKGSFRGCCPRIRQCNSLYCIGGPGMRTLTNELAMLINIDRCLTCVHRHHIPLIRADLASAPPPPPTPLVCAWGVVAWWIRISYNIWPVTIPSWLQAQKSCQRFVDPFLIVRSLELSGIVCWCVCMSGYVCCCVANAVTKNGVIVRIVILCQAHFFSWQKLLMQQKTLVTLFL